jgi:rhodanese-related sulfurtransferase
LVDVHSPEEHVSSVIPSTDLNFDFREMKSRHREIGAQLDDHIVVFCQSGHRSNNAAETLADLGWRYVYSVTGSTTAWMEAVFPIERPQR